MSLIVLIILLFINFNLNLGFVYLSVDSLFTALLLFLIILHILKKKKVLFSINLGALVLILLLVCFYSMSLIGTLKTIQFIIATVAGYYLAKNINTILKSKSLFITFILLYVISFFYGFENINLLVLKFLSFGALINTIYLHSKSYITTLDRNFKLILLGFLILLFNAKILFILYFIILMFSGYLYSKKFDYLIIFKLFLIGTFLLVSLMSIFPEKVSNRISDISNPLQSSSTLPRIILIVSAYEAFKFSPILGNGVGVFNRAEFFNQFYNTNILEENKSENIVQHNRSMGELGTSSGAHNLYLDIAVSGGMILLIFIIYIIIKSLKITKKNKEPIYLLFLFIAIYGMTWQLFSISLGTIFLGMMIYYVDQGKYKRATNEQKTI